MSDNHQIRNANINSFPPSLISKNIIDYSMAFVAFRALQIVHEQRNAYGLRDNDFQRYRKHCANRTHRLRCSLKMTHGKGREFKKLPSLNLDTAKAEHLQILLLEAERGWAYAQELINVSLQPTNTPKANKLRHIATGRFRRAVNWSTRLLSVCQTLYASSRMSALCLIEATVFTVLLNSRFLRYRDEFEDALIQLCVARGLLDDLANVASTSRDQALATLFSDEIGPEIRFCAHKLGHQRAYDVNNIVSEIYPKYRNQIVENYDDLVTNLQKDRAANPKITATLRERIWDGQVIPVRYPELVDVFLKVDAAEVALDKVGPKKTKAGVTAYDAVLSTLSDAEGVARRLQESQKLTDSLGSGSQAHDIDFVHAYITFQLLSRRIQRDFLLMNTLLVSSGAEKAKGSGLQVADQQSKPEFDGRLFPAIVKLFNTIIQSLTQMRTLSIVEENPKLASAIDVYSFFAKARRCSYLARCYSSVKGYAQALTLLQHAALHTRETISALPRSDSDPIIDERFAFFPLSRGDVKELNASINEDSFQYKREWFAYNGGSTENTSFHKKPLFFNIALNYVNLDMDRLRDRAGKERMPTVELISSTQEQIEKKVLSKARVEELSTEAASVPTPQPAQRGLGSLLGGWWK